MIYYGKNYHNGTMEKNYGTIPYILYIYYSL